MSKPLHLRAMLWPDVVFYREQRLVIESVWANDETYVPAGNKLGKDFVSGFISLAFFLTRWPCRVMTTSVDGTQLASVLWGEIRRFLATSRFPLEVERGGPLVVNHLHIRRFIHGAECGVSYMRGRVAAKGEGMLGHHVTPGSKEFADLARRGVDLRDGVPRTLFVADEASGVEDGLYEAADTWAQRKLIIGNPYPCANFFKRGVKAGDMEAA